MKASDVNAVCRSLALALGFPLLPGMRFELDGVRYCLTAADIEALRVLAKIRSAWPSQPDVYWLLPFRSLARRCRAGTIFAYAAQQSQDPAMRCLAVWLRGRRRGRLGSDAVARLYRGMHAWAALRRIEACEDDPRIRRLARQKRPTAYGSRMTQFMTNVARGNARSGPARYFEQPGLELDAGRSPRPASFFRVILERIRRLVRAGETSCAPKAIEVG